MSNLVFYRKYRPQRFAEFIGQEHIIQTITNAIVNNLVAHAYLFSGPRGSGKTTLARLLAKAINCEKRKGFEPSNECFACQEINRGAAVDLIEIDAASHRGIDKMRQLKEGIRVVPTRLKNKVFIIDECLTGDHLITMADGRTKKISEVKNGERVMSIDLENGYLVEGEIKDWFKKKTNKLVKIRTPQAILKCTPTHRLWILRDDKFILVPAKEAKLGDFLLSPVALPYFQKNNLSPEQLSFLALIQCDGHISKDSITIQIEIRKDPDYFIQSFRKGIQAWGIREKPVIKETSRGTTLIRIYSKTLKDVLTELGCPAGKKSNRIDIPDVVFQAPLESIKAYLDTCFCCEGDIIPWRSPGSINYRLNFTSTSEIFAKKIQLLLKKFGIGSNILEIESKNRKHLTKYRVSLSGYNLRLFSLNIGLTLERKANLLQKHLLKKEKQDSIPIEKLVLKKREERQIFYSRLASFGVYPALGQHLIRKSVETLIDIGNLPELNRFLKFRYEKVKKVEVINKNEWVYDFTVEGTHTFIVNGVCSSNCHQLTKEASNALLKTLEEPPRFTYFILATTEIQKVIPTIISRCQRFDFTRLRVSEIIKKIELICKSEKRTIESAASRLIAINARGSMRDAESLLDQAFTFCGPREIRAQDIGDLLGLVDTQVLGQWADLIFKRDAAQAIKFLGEIIEAGLDLDELLKALVNYLRSGLLWKMGATGNPELADLSKEESQILSRQVEPLSIQELSQILETFLQAANRMKYSPLPQLSLELAILEICDELK